MEGLIQKTMMNRDAAGFAAIVKGQVTSDFKYTDTPGGKPMGFDQMVAGMRAGFAAMTKVTVAEAKILNVTPKNPTTTATVMMIHTMNYISTDPTTKKNHTHTFRGVSIDTYKNLNGVWKMSSMAWKSTEMTKDGVHVKAA